MLQTAVAREVTPGRCRDLVERRTMLAGPALNDPSAARATDSKFL